jgi:DNA invertase Pin-like site-specific DNA recombinase
MTPDHLAKHALVSVRQSTPNQGWHHQESQRLPYALVERARPLGWHQIEVSEDDLGHRASTGTPRVGFKQLLAPGVLGEVGIVLSTEVARLSRPEKDWGHLLALCKGCDPLRGDAEHGYDITLTDDQLILGIKGTLRVRAASVLKSRLFQGQEPTAKRGDLYQLVAPGYLGVEGKALVKDPTVRVQEALALVFATFRELWSVRQGFKWFHAEGIALPVTKAI